MIKTKVFSVLLVLLLLFNSNIFSQNQIVGTYYYQGNTEVPIPDIYVELFNLNDSLIASTTTDNDGMYSFQGVPDGEYYIYSSTDMESVGIDLYDAYRVLFYLLGWIEFNDIEFEVADVDNNDQVSWYDYFYILINYLILDQPFPGEAWTFEPIDIDFALRTSNDTINPWGSSEGDVDGGWDPSGRDIDLFNYSMVASNYLNKKETSELLISADIDGNLNGFNLNLGYNSESISIISISGPDENFNYSINDKDGVIKVAWINENQGTSIVDGSQLFTLEVEETSTMSYSNEQIITVLPGGMLIDSENNKINDAEIKLPLMQNKQTVELTVEAYPNPVLSSLNFNVQSNKQGQASLSIYDLSGKLVRFLEYVDLYEGDQSIRIDTENLLPGNYIYSLDLSGLNESSIKGRFVKSK